MASGQQATVTKSGRSYRTVITGSPLGNVCFFKCKICQVKLWMFLGVGADLALDGQSNFSALNTYGWSKNSCQYAKSTHLSCPAAQWASGDWVLIKADFLAGKLSMISTQVNTPLTISLEVPANLQDRYVFQVIMYDCNDQVELLQVTAQDQQLLS